MFLLFRDVFPHKFVLNDTAMWREIPTKGQCCKDIFYTSDVALDHKNISYIYNMYIYMYIQEINRIYIWVTSTH